MCSARDADAQKCDGNIPACGNCTKNERCMLFLMMLDRIRNVAQVGRKGGSCDLI